MTKTPDQQPGQRTGLSRRLGSAWAVWRYRSQSALGPRIIVVTGAVGKTTTVRLLAELLREAGSSVLEMVAAKEANHSFEVDTRWLHRELRAARRARVDVVIIEAHDQFTQTLAYKSVHIDTVVAVTDNPQYGTLSAQGVRHVVLPSGLPIPDGVAHHNVMTFGDDPAADMKVEKVKLYRKGTEIDLLIDQHTTMQVASHLVGQPNVANVVAAVATAYVLGVDVMYLAEGVARVESVPGNVSYIADTPGGYHVAIDHARMADSLEAVVASAKQYSKRRVLVAVGYQPDEAAIGRTVQYADRLVVTGHTRIKGAEAAPDPDEAAWTVLRAARRDDTVLLIGAEYSQADAYNRVVTIINRRHSH